MKIAYATTYNSSDVHAWSGLGSYILRALEGAGFQTAPIGNLNTSHVFSWRSRVKRYYYQKLFSKTYMAEREPSLLKEYAAQIETTLGGIPHDIVFSPGTLPIACLQSQKPIVFWTDATFSGLVDFYPGFDNLCAETIRHGNKMDQLALSKCHLAIYSSEWAANCAIQDYDVDPNKVKVVPFGSNIRCTRTLDDIEKLVENKSFDTCKLLLLGVDWQRKGGEMALAVATRLNERGIPTELHVAGCQPPYGLPDFVVEHGFISKKTDEGRQRLERLMSESHFLIVPSKAECYGVVFAEASSFGVPALATDVGGIPTVVRDGKNGWTFPLDSTPDKYCNRIEALMTSKESYQKLAQSSFQEYTSDLNWQSAGAKVRELIRSICQ